MKSGSEEGELKDSKAHPMVTVTKIDKDEIPEVSNKFLLRGDRETEKDHKNRERKNSDGDKDRRYF